LPCSCYLWLPICVSGPVESLVAPKVARDANAEPKEVVKIERVVVEGPPQIKIIPKESVRIIYRDLPTPPTVANENAVVTAVCDIPPSPQGGTAVSV